MLWHLCQHLTFVNALYGKFRLIWAADVISLAERFVAEIDWKHVSVRYPLILNTLSLFHFLTPLSDRLLKQTPIKIGGQPHGIGQEFRGWPNSALAFQREKGLRHILSDTFCPSEWWLRLYYGLGSVRPVFWHRWVRHPLYILELVGQLLRERAKTKAE